MAKIYNVLRYVDDIKPNRFTDDTKVQWLNEVEGYIQTEVMMLALADVVQYDPETHMHTDLLVKPPHDKLYALYLCAMIDFANGEYDKYANTMQLYNEFLGEYIGWYTLHFRPADGGCVREGYYLSAYAIAVAVSGFEGTVEEWLESLKGEDAYDAARKYGYTGTREEFGQDQARFAENAAQVRLDREAAAVSEQAALRSAEAAAVSEQAALRSAEAAEDARKTASESAAEAKTSQESAAASKKNAGESAAEAENAKNETAALAQAAQTLAGAAESAARRAETAASDSETAAQHAAQSANTAENSASSAGKRAEAAETAATDAATSAAEAEKIRTSVEQTAANIPGTVQDALRQAKESGAFDGEDGKTPEKGVDYWTESDKSGIVADVLAALPTWEGGSY